MSVKHTILEVGPLPAAPAALLRTAFDVIALPNSDPADVPDFDRQAAYIRTIATFSKGRIDRALLDRLPNVDLIVNYSAGMEGTDLDAVKEKGIRFETTSTMIAPDVADIGLVLMLSVLRRIAELDRYVRAGIWDDPFGQPHGRSAGCRKAGIVGYGNLGRAVGERLIPVVDEIRYNGPNEKPDTPFDYEGDLTRLAEWADVLILCCPGGDSTRHLVNDGILKALGTTGILVNIARGTVVDQKALIAALKDGTIAGAGLDVYDGEPAVPAELLAMDNVVLLPHIGSATEETRLARAEWMVATIRAHLDGTVPEDI